MQLNIHAREIQEVVILELSGRVVAGEEVDSVRRMIHDLVDHNHKKISLNLDQVARIDSTGIGMLVEAVIYTVKQGGRLSLYMVPRLVRSILTTHRLLQAFEIYGSEAEALAGFEKSTAQPDLRA
ncbi:MAG TPA: STAS domain-containing protein [Terriglobia bacterium]|nr:STAS domain-containing protein [Terriglobia bacterium]